MSEWPCFAQKFRYGIRILFGFRFGFAGSRALQFFLGCSWALPAQVQGLMSVQVQQLRSSALVQISETGLCVWHCVDKPDSADSDKECSA